MQLEDDIDVVGQGKDGDEALRLVEELKPDLLLTDIEMPLSTLKICYQNKETEVIGHHHEDGVARFLRERFSI